MKSEKREICNKSTPGLQESVFIKTGICIY